MGFFQKISEGLKKTKESMMQKVERIFNSFRPIDEELFEELEETLIMSDVGDPLRRKSVQGSERA